MTARPGAATGGPRGLARRHQLPRAGNSAKLRLGAAAAACLRAVGRPGEHAGDDGHRPQPGDRRSGGGRPCPRDVGRRLRARRPSPLPPRLRADRAEGRPRRRVRISCGASGAGPGGDRRRRAAGSVDTAARCGAGRVGVMEFAPGPGLSQAHGDLRRPGDCGDGPGDGLRQCRRELGHGGAVHPRPACRLAQPFGEYLPCGQGEDVVSGERTPMPLSCLAERLPDVHADLLRAGRLLEREGRDVQDIEFNRGARDALPAPVPRGQACTRGGGQAGR